MVSAPEGRRVARLWRFFLALQGHRAQEELQAAAFQGMEQARLLKAMLQQVQMQLA